MPTSTVYILHLILGQVYILSSLAGVSITHLCVSDLLRLLSTEFMIMSYEKQRLEIVSPVGSEPTEENLSIQMLSQLWRM